MKFTDWMPVISKLVYPILFVLALFIFSDEAKEIYDEIVTKGRGAKIGLFEISARASEVKIQAMSSVSVGLDVIAGIEPQSDADAGNIVRKSSAGFLRTVQEQLKKNPDRSTIKSLTLENGKRYSVNLLREYINQLGIENIVFMNKRKFAGLIEARLLINQLSADAIIPYERIFEEVLGINKLFVFEDVSTLDVLKKMEKNNIDKIAVVNKDQSLRFIANRDVIVSKLITSIITQENDKHPQQ